MYHHQNVLTATITTIRNSDLPAKMEEVSSTNEMNTQSRKQEDILPYSIQLLVQIFKKIFPFKNGNKRLNIYTF
jgi:prophage maintenance system killer protein